VGWNVDLVYFDDDRSGTTFYTYWGLEEKRGMGGERQGVGKR